MYRYAGKSVTGPQPQSTAVKTGVTVEGQQKPEDERVAAMKRRLREKSRASAFGGKRNGS